MDTWIMWIIGCSVAFWIGQAVGSQLTSYRILKAIADDPDAFINISKKIKKINEATTHEELNAIDIKSSAPKDAILMEVEEINGYVYAYNKVTGEFLSQAHDIEQAVRIASQRFPGKTFWHPSLEQNHQTA